MHPILEEILLDIDRLEPFPEVAIRVLELSLQEETGPQELVEVIKTDAGITSKVLKLANSALHGLRVTIPSIEHAGVHLGEKALVSLVITSASRSYFMGMGSSTPRSNHSLWEESVANAIASRLVARMDGSPDPEAAYTVGLLQNIGHVLLDRFLVRERDEVLGRVDTGMSLLAAESQVLGMNHSQIGARMARRWDFPAILVDAILHHHAPHLSVLDPRLCAETNLGEAVTWHVLGYQNSPALTHGVASETTELIDTQKGVLAQIGEEVLGELERQRELLGLEETARH
jgi:HD-like signal output (HDOD) protein